MFIREAPQRRQSEGNNVAKRPAATPLAQETHGLSCSTTLVPVPRIGVPLLLKTILPRPTAATGAPTGRIFLSIAVPEAGRNEHKGTCHLVHAVGLEKRTRTAVSFVERLRARWHVNVTYPLLPVTGQTLIDIFRRWASMVVVLKAGEYGLLHATPMLEGNANVSDLSSLICCSPSVARAEVQGAAHLSWSGRR